MNQPRATDRYWFIARDESPTLHLDAECSHLNHATGDDLSSASIVRWQAYHMAQCSDCVTAEHQRTLSEARREREEEYLEARAAREASE